MDLWSLSVWNRYSRKLGGGDWDTDSGKSHAVDHGRTLCGVYVGAILDGWERNLYASAATDETVSCRRCLAALARA